MKFGIVGASGVVVNLGVGIILHLLNGGAANAGDPVFWITEDNAFRYRNLVWILSFLVANLWNYQLNRSWTFRGSRVPWWRGFWQFLAIGSVAMLIGLLLQWGFTHPSTPLYLSSDWFTSGGGLRSREYWAQLLAIALTMPVNFVVNKLWTFRHREEEVEQP